MGPGQDLPKLLDIAWGMLQQILSIYPKNIVS
jgi:hypothetical protein